MSGGERLRQCSVRRTKCQGKEGGVGTFSGIGGGIFLFLLKTPFFS